MRDRILVSCVVLLCFLAAPAFSIGVAEPVTGFFSYVFGLFSYADDAPEITDAFLNQYKFVPGDYMMVTARVVDDQGVEEVKAEIEHDAGVDVVNLILVTGDKKEGTYQGQWVVHDCSARSYDAKIVAVDSSGQESYKVLVWEDPLVCNPGHRAEDVCPGEFGGNATGAGLKDYSFPGDLDVTNDLNVNQGITLGGVRKTEWPSSTVPPSGAILWEETANPTGFTYTGECLVTGREKWNIKSPMLTGRHLLGAASVNGRIYTIGGYAGGVTSSKNEEYDPATNTWATKTPMPTVRGRLTVASVNGKIYAIGGRQFSTYDINEEYDPAMDTWATKTPMPTARMDLTSAVVNDKIYVFGGQAFANRNLNEVYDPATDTWATKAVIPIGRELATATAVNGKIYVIGGRWFKDTNFEYDPDGDSWATKAPMLSGRHGAAAATVDNKIYVIGGFDGGGEIATTEEYDPFSDLWMAREDMPTARQGLVAVTINDRDIYVIGGSTVGVSVPANEEYKPPITYYLMSKD